jgi:protein-tyrosine phosphatase
MTQISERLFIGSKEDQPFSHHTCVLSLASDLFVLYHEKLEYSQIGLIDGPGNQLSMIAVAPCVLRQLLERHESVMLICHGGTGRSGLVAALYMAVRHEIDFDQALTIVQNKRPTAVPNDSLKADGAAAIPLLQMLFKGGC